MKTSVTSIHRWKAVALGCAVLATAFALLLGACGGTDEETTSPSATPVASPSVVPAEEPVSQWDSPGSASAAQTRAVAKTYAATVSTEKFQAGLYAKDATWDYWESDMHDQGGKDIAGNYRGAAGSFDWSKVHILSAPGVAADEGMLKATGTTSSTVFLTLLAVDGTKVVHEEVFLDNPGSFHKQRVVFASSSPGPKDTAEVAAEVASAMGDAFAAGDRGAIEGLAAADVLFYDTELLHGVRGVDALLEWQSKTPSVELANQEPMAGPGWAVVRWTVRQVMPTGVEVAMPGATVFEVRDGKVARMTLYYDSEVIALQE
jgi:ketosteroid isomerase-like protein